MHQCKRLHLVRARTPELSRRVKTCMLSASCGIKRHKSSPWKGQKAGVLEFLHHDWKVKYVLEDSKLVVSPYALEASRARHQHELLRYIWFPCSLPDGSSPSRSFDQYIMHQSIKYRDDAYAGGIVMHYAGSPLCSFGVQHRRRRCNLERLEHPTCTKESHNMSGLDLSAVLRYCT